MKHGSICDDSGSRSWPRVSRRFVSRQCWKPLQEVGRASSLTSKSQDMQSCHSASCCAKIGLTTRSTRIPTPNTFLQSAPAMPALFPSFLHLRQLGNLPPHPTGPGIQPWPRCTNSTPTRDSPCPSPNQGVTYWPSQSRSPVPFCCYFLMHLPPPRASGIRALTGTLSPQNISDLENTQVTWFNPTVTKKILKTFIQSPSIY